MCGRFTLTVPLFSWADLMGAEPPPEFEPRCNVAPMQKILTLRRRPGEAAARFEFVKWGLIPSWAKDAKLAARLINARGETVAEKPMFRSAFKHRRCAIPADGFYEWKLEGKRKIPHHFKMRDGAPFALAGLWETWNDPKGQTVETCTIVTTISNDILKPFHERMPVILDPSECRIWLDPEIDDPAILLPLLRPYPAEKMTEHLVSDRLNDPRHEGDDCM